MTDCDAVIRSLFASRTAITNLTDSRIYAGNHLPPDYTPDIGPALLLENQGIRQDYTSKILSVSYRIRCFGLTALLARQLDRAVYDSLNDYKSNQVRHVEMSTGGQLLQEPTTNWFFVLSSYLVVFENS
jgi:hypothetical protein